MSSNMIIFDAEYIAELTGNMNTACTLLGEAVNALKKASLHEGWKCKECATISENLDDLNLRLGRLDKGVNETTRILRGSVSRFAELEAKYKAHAESLSEDLRSNYGFTASGYSEPSEPAEAANTEKPGITSQSMNTPNTLQLPVSQIPYKPEAAALGVKTAHEVEGAAVIGVTGSIMTILGGNANFSSMTQEQRSTTIRTIEQTYNTGKQVVNNAAVIMKDPSEPHASEHIAIASGLVSLCGGLSGAISAGENADSVPANAESIIETIGDDSDSEEVKEVLRTFTSDSSKSTGDKFLDKVKSSIIGTMQGDETFGFFGSVIQDFLDKVF